MQISVADGKIYQVLLLPHCYSCHQKRWQRVDCSDWSITSACVSREHAKKEDECEPAMPYAVPAECLIPFLVVTFRSGGEGGIVSADLTFRLTCGSAVAGDVSPHASCKGRHE